MFRLLFALIALTPLIAVHASELTYEADVRPILKAHCFHCHGDGNVVEGNLDLRLRRFIVKGGDSGPAIVPGIVDESLLLHRIDSGEMPPGDEQKLSAKEIETLRRWIKADAPTAHAEPDTFNPDTYFTHVEKNWWAFQPVKKPQAPTPPAEAAAPVDSFLFAKLRQKKLSFSPKAERETLIRRVYLDMLGLPPSPDDVRRFVADDHPDAWSRLVDRVLASPHYGERWGRHWLDAAGYADSEGYTEEDRVREHAWRYRDYVIRAFNQDKPYSRFVTEQLAGDELAGWPGAELTPESIELLTATGFLRMAPDGTATGGVDQGLARNQVVADTLQVVCTSLLGMTVHCAQCHNHRYDPIPQRDYYQLRAIFEPAIDWKNWRTPPARRVSLYSEQDKRRKAEIEERAKKIDAKRKQRVDHYIDKTLEHELLMVADELQARLRAAFRTKASDRTDEQKKLLDDHTNVAKITAGSLYLYDRRRDARAKDLDERREQKQAAFLEKIKREALASLDDDLRRDVVAAFEAPPDNRTDVQRQLVRSHPAAGVTAETLAKFDPDAAKELEQYSTAAAEIRKFRIRSELQELADQAKAVRDTIPKEHFLRMLSEPPNHVPATYVFHRGDHQQPKDLVKPQGLTILGAAEIPIANDLKTSGRRLQFAQRLTSGEHPLTARVFVNRVWAGHFGRGIVSTTGDFGRLGERPTHPELLDWLAAEFVEQGWSVKQLHRLILGSHAYQQSSSGSPQSIDADPDNLLLGRWPLRRLESEALRDTIMSTSGKLNPTMYGEPVPVMEDAVGRIVLGKENLDGERKPTDPIPLLDDKFRRSLYVQVRRTRPLGVLESFDLPDLAPNCTERPSSNVAPQSLMLMNSDFILEMAQAMAERLMVERPDDPLEQLRWGWKLAYCRSSSPDQLKGAERFLTLQTAAYSEKDRPDAEARKAALASYCQALLGSNQFLYIE